MKWDATNSAGYDAPVGLAVDIVVLTVRDGQLHVLAHERDGDAFALPGGFVGPTESADDTVGRKLTAKTGVGEVYAEQLRLYSQPGRDPRGWVPSMAYMALVPASVLPDSSDAQWVAVEDLPAMAFDHADMVADAVTRLRGKLMWSNVAVGLLDDEFSLSQAKAIYDAIIGKTQDAANFGRDLKRSGLIEATGATRAEGPGRPASMFRFISRDLTWGPGRRS